MPIFKYFTHEEHALALINKGEMMMQPLSHFRGREDDGARGDPLDGILSYAPKGGLILNMEDGREVILKDSEFNSSGSQHDIYVYCASNQKSVALAEFFGPFCVEIRDPQVLLRRLRARAHPTSKLDYEQIVCGKVEYREQDKEPKEDWALPERLVFIKPPLFKSQDEFRIAMGTRGALGVENVRLTIRTGPPVCEIERSPPPIFVRLGKLHDFTALHRIDVASGV